VARLTGLLSYHQALLADVRRNRAFHRALRCRVRRGSRVLDLGAGTGIWAVTAARLGAREVVAVEREALLCPVIEDLARENGVADRVRVVCGDARRVRLPRVFDVVVSETVGSEAIDEGIIEVLWRARERFLAPGGALVPEPLALWGAPAAPFEPRRPSPAILAAESVASLTVNAPRTVSPHRLLTLAPPRELLRVDLRSALPRVPLPVARTRYRLLDGRAMGGLGLWVRMGLAPGASLSTRTGTSWFPVFLPAEPLPRGPGRLDVEIDWNPARRRWRFEFQPDHGKGRVLDYTPLFAWGRLGPRAPSRPR